VGRDFDHAASAPPHVVTRGKTFVCTPRVVRFSIKQKMSTARLVAFLLVVCACSGCGPEKFKTTFYLNRAVFEEQRGDGDPGVETTNALIRTGQFWSRYVAPALVAKITEEESMRSSIDLSLGKGRDGLLSEVTLSMSCASEAEITRIADAIIDGLDRYMSATDSGKNGPYVHGPKKASKPPEPTTPSGCGSRGLSRIAGGVVVSDQRCEAK
jgi:hypothetical protein